MRPVSLARTIALRWSASACVRIAAIVRSRSSSCCCAMRSSRARRGSVDGGCGRHTGAVTQNAITSRDINQMIDSFAQTAIYGASEAHRRIAAALTSGCCLLAYKVSIVFLVFHTEIVQQLRVEHDELVQLDGPWRRV